MTTTFHKFFVVPNAGKCTSIVPRLILAAGLGNGIFLFASPLTSQKGFALKFLLQNNNTSMLPRSKDVSV